MDEAKLIKAIEHYQKNLERYLAKSEDAKILHCIERLSSLPIEVAHLQKTGVGRTVNGLRKLSGEVGDAARSLVNKWKDMVSQDESEEKQEKQNSSHSSEDYSENDSQSSRCEQDEDGDGGRNEKSRKLEKKRQEEKKRDDSRRRKDEREESRRKEELKRREEKEEMRRREELKEELKKEQQELKRKEEKDEKRRRDEKEESRRKADDSSKNGNKRKRDDDLNGHSKHKKSSSSEEPKTSSKSSSSSSSGGGGSSSKHKRSTEESVHRSKDEKKRKSSSNDKKESSSSSSGTSTGSSAKKKKVVADDGIDCESGTSFADALMMHSPSVKVNSGGGSSRKPTSSSLSSSSFTTTKTTIVQKSSSSSRRLESSTSSSSSSSVAFPIAPLPEKLEDISIATMLPSITTNYKPLGNTFREMDLNSKAKKVQDDEALSRLMYAKNQRTKVYSGNKVAFGKMPSLFELCTRVLQDNIEALEYTGGVPYAILKPVLDKATPDQLFSLEYHNPYIIDDSDELWSFHCLKEFRGKKRQEMETCRDMYMRCLNERETKLKALTANIKLSQDKSVPVRQTKLAYVDSVVKPPRNVAKKQAKNGVDNNKKPMITPSSRLNAIAAAGAAGQVSVPNHVTERSSSSASSSYSKPQKKAPLMAKTLQLMKGRFRR